MGLITHKKLIPVDSGIHHLLERSQAGTEATEEDVKNLLRRYSVKDALLSFGALSIAMYFDPKLPGRQNASMLFTPDTGIVITQFALSYLASMSILSGSNDYKAPLTAPGKSNVDGICNIYSNALSTPISEQEIKEYGPAPFLMRMATEQFAYQISGSYMLARTSVMFLEIAAEIEPQNLRTLDSFFQEKTGITLHDFLWLSFCFFALLQEAPTFRAAQLLEADMPPHYMALFTEEKITKFLELMALDYASFREVDESMNSRIRSSHTKTRFNPLIQFPIIKLQTPSGPNPYIVPNVITYLRRITDGLYWWFDEQFAQEGGSERDKFRSYFGKVFEEYVGQVLKAIYGDSMMNKEFFYGTKKSPIAFIDWWMIKNNKLYLFEAKASQVNLYNRTVCDPEKYKLEEIPKIAKAIKQLFLRIKDIQGNTYPELQKFQGMEVIPVAIFYDMPFVAEKGLYGHWLNEELVRMESNDPNLVGLASFKAHLINISELEPFESLAGSVPLEDIFYKNEQLGGQTNISSTMASFGQTKSGFLDGAYARFFRPMHSPGNKLIDED